MGQVKQESDEIDQSRVDPEDMAVNLEDKFWLTLREPGMVPDRKGPWAKEKSKEILREFIKARPTAYIDYITIGEDGPQIEHGPEVLQILDARSMIVGTKQNKRVSDKEQEIAKERSSEIWTIIPHKERSDRGTTIWTELCRDGQHIAHFPDHEEAERVYEALIKKD